MLYLLTQITVPNSDIDKWLLGLLFTTIGVLFYLLRDSYLARIAEAAGNAKIIIDIQQKNYELLVGLKSSIDASNEATANLITVLSNAQNADLKQQIKDLKDQKKGGN